MELPNNRMPRILVAEDNPAVGEFVARALQAEAYEVVVVADGVQALEQLQKEPFDLLITDIVMPNMDGIDLASQASAKFPDLRIILMSGYAQERLRAHNLDAVVQMILSKPFSLEDLREAVEEVFSL